MRLSIRNQILIPILGIQAVAVAFITVATATLSAGRSEREIIVRLNGVMTTLDQANFPLTTGVLAKMRGLSGAHYAVANQNGRILETTLVGFATLPRTLQSLRPRDRLDSLHELATFDLDRTRYFAARARRSQGSDNASLLFFYPVTSWQRAKWDAALPPLALGLGTLGILAATTNWTARRISRRIHQVQEKVARIAAGDFEGFDPGPQRDEVQELASSVNQLCHQLKQMHAILRKSERTQLLAQMAAGLAHQLRNSLTGARMSIQLHVRRSPPREGDETLSVALRQLAMTEEQVKGLLSLGRVEPGQPIVCEVGRLLDEIASLVNPSCRHARVILHHQSGPGPFPVRADAAGLRSAVLNLTLNAIEAATPGGLVELCVATEDDHVTIEVSDNGPGPPPAIADTLFEAFVTSKPEGVGLGLAIASQVAIEHGGRISWLRRDGTTRFSLTIPKGAA